jgi:hypothetical protein
LQKVTVSLISRYFKLLFFAVIFFTALSGCVKEQFATVRPSVGSIKTFAVTVVVDQAKPGYRIPSEFEGLSYETDLIAGDNGFLDANNPVVVQLIKNLGKGILRIGGNSSDEIEWAGAETPGKTLKKKLTTADVDRLAAFSKAIGWPVLFGLNLGNYNPQAAAAEAYYVESRLGRDLFAFQSGNEPDVFYRNKRTATYNYADYQKEWDIYFKAVKKTAPKAWFSGPDADPFNPFWMESFVKNEYRNIRLMDAHYYNTGPASNPAITYNDILKPNPLLYAYLLQLSKMSVKYHIPYRISETNSIWGRGKPGISDAFASALWALDFMWAVAENNGHGVNFHGGGSHFIYTPIGIENGQYVPHPEYYAMLAFKYGGAMGTIIPATIADPRDYYNLNAYACIKSGNAYSITLINKDETANYSVTVQLSKAATSMTVDRLTAPSVTSKTGTTFAGSAIKADGTFTPSTKEQALGSKTFVVDVPAGSAVVVTVK